MNEELQKAILNIVNASMDAVGHARDFAIEQAPDVVQQFLAWELLNSLMLCGLSVICAAVSLVCFYRLIRTTDKDGGMSLYGPYYLAGGAFLAVIALLAFNTQWLHIWVAPKDYLIRAAINVAK